MLQWLLMLLVVVVIVVVARYVPDGLIRVCFYLLALVVAVYAVIRFTGIG